MERVARDDRGKRVEIERREIHYNYLISSRRGRGERGERRGKEI